MQRREVAHSKWELVTSVVQSSYSECYNFLMKHKLSELPLKVCILSLRGFESRQTAILTGANLQSISNIASAEFLFAKKAGLVLCRSAAMSSTNLAEYGIPMSLAFG